MSRSGTVNLVWTVRGMSRPLLKLCGGSGEILRDVRHGDIKSESLVARAPGR